MADKTLDLAGPGIGNYEELAEVLPQDYNPLLTPRETQTALFAVKNYIEEKPLQGTEPDDGSGAAHRGQDERGER